MKSFLIFVLLTFSMGESFSQKIQGTYVGKIFSDRNALVLEADKEGLVTGSLYVNPTMHFVFMGTYLKPKLKGTLTLNSAKKIAVEGDLKDNFLKIMFADSSEKRASSLHKISTKTGIDMDDLFSEEYDMLLLGKWQQVKKIISQGEDVLNAALIHEFGFRGKGVVYLGSPPKNVPRLSGRNLSGISTRFDMGWETRDGKLICKEHHPELPRLGFSGVLDYTVSYVIKNDTLVTTKSTNEFAYYWKRK